MKKYLEALAVFSVILSTVGVVLAFVYFKNHQDSSKSTQGRIFVLEARGISTWSTNEIHAKKGEALTIRIHNVDNVTHGFAIPELDVGEQIIRAGEYKNVKILPKFAGRYIYQCVVQCSMDKHEFMRGTLIVE